MIQVIVNIIVMIATTQQGSGPIFTKTLKLKSMLKLTYKLIFMSLD